MMIGIVRPMKMNEVDPDNSGGGSGYDIPAEGGDGSETPAEGAAADATPAEEGGSDDPNTDEFGYAKVPKEGEKAEEKKPEPKEGDDPKAGEDSSTGYGEDEPKVDEPETPAEEPPPAEDTTKELGYNLAEVKFDTIDDKEKDAMSKFIKENKVPKDLVEKYIELRKSEIAEFKKQMAGADEQAKIALQKQRATWHKELKDDPTFGGDKFAFNIKQANKSFGDLLPNTKKALTGKGTVLPPYLMRDLAALAQKVYGTETMVHGSPAVPEQEIEDGFDEFGYKK